MNNATNNTATKPTKIQAGEYQYKGYTIERRENGEWYTGPIGDWAQDVTDTLAEAIDMIDQLTTTEENDMIDHLLTDNEKAQMFTAALEAQAADWLAQNSHLLPAAELDAGLPSMPANKLSGKYSEIDAYINATEEGAECFNEYTATGRDSFSRQTEEPSSDMGDSMACPEMLGRMSASRSESRKADIARATHGIKDICYTTRGNSTALVLRKNKRLSKAEQIRARRAAKQQSLPQLTAEVVAPAYSAWTGRPAPYAHTDAGNGPLSIVDMPAPETLSASVEEVVLMSPIVDTIGYESGRSPFQLQARAAKNSDITG